LSSGGSHTCWSGIGDVTGGETSRLRGKKLLKPFSIEPTRRHYALYTRRGKGRGKNKIKKGGNARGVLLLIRIPQPATEWMAGVNRLSLEFTQDRGKGGNDPWYNTRTLWREYMV